MSKGLYKRVYTLPHDKFFREGQFWTPLDCEILIKINSAGFVAVVHDALNTFINVIDKYGVPAHVAEDDTLNWFEVYWDEEGNYPGSDETNTCSANQCKILSDGNCLCRTTVSEVVVFSDIEGITKADVMSQLKIGAVGPDPNSLAVYLNNDVTVHIVGSVVDETTVFEIQDRGVTIFLKNLVSTVSLFGWEMPPQIYEAESASALNFTSVTSFISERDNVASATGGSYVVFDVATDHACIEFNVDIADEGDYMVSFRYATDLTMRFLSVFVNDDEITREPANTVVNAANPPNASLPLLRCQECNADWQCGLGLICSQNSAYSGEVPGCLVPDGGTNHYCVDPGDFSYGVAFVPTGDDRFRMNLNNGFDDWESWYETDPLRVALIQGLNVIKLQVPPGYDAQGLMVDNMKIEGLPTSVSNSSFRNAPHFMGE